MRKNPVLEKSYAFSLDVIHLYRGMQARGEFILLKQLVRAGTGVGANVEEAMAAQSRRDFLSKMSIARKEARESNYWLRLVRDSGLATADETQPLLRQVGRTDPIALGDNYLHREKSGMITGTVCDARP